MIKPTIFVLWTIFLLGLLLAPIGDIEKWQFLGFKHWDKVGHFILFGVTGFVYIWSASYFKTITVRTLFALMLSSFLAMVTEGLQRFVARTPAFCDLLADIAGLLSGILIFVLLEVRNKCRYVQK